MTVRTIRHPIAAFVLAVVAVIGLGVGVVAATTNPRVYGPSWGRFTVGFPGRVYDGFQTAQIGRNSVRFTTTAAFDYATFQNGWTGYALLSIPRELDTVYGVQVHGTGSAVAAASVRSAKKLYFHPGVTESVQAEIGFVATTIGPQCIKGECKEVLVVTNGQALWELLSFSRGPASTVEGFIASFQPIG